MAYCQNYNKIANASRVTFLFDVLDAAYFVIVSNKGPTDLKSTTSVHHSIGLWSPLGPDLILT